MERISVDGVAGDRSEITIAADGLGSDPVGVLLTERRERAAVALLAQPRSAALAEHLAGVLEATGLRSEVRVLPDGEEGKRLSVVEDCVLWLNGVGLTRADTILGVGGGALTDLAGFLGAIYLRGVEVCLFPTTLLASVDAAIGGKTAVNIGGKNLAGVFRMPAKVTIDLQFLEELPTERRREGSAEILKAGLIADPEIVALYEQDGLEAPLAVVVPAAVRVKAAIVGEDPTEQGRRAILNYGHTIGHAVEVAASLQHGHAVAVGMVAAGAASRVKTGFEEEDRQRAVIEKLGLPTAAQGVAKAEVLELMALDKKRSSRGSRMVVLRQIGSAAVVDVDEATVDIALAAVGIG